MSQSPLQKFLVKIKNGSSKIDWKCVSAVLVAFLVTRLMIAVVAYFSLAQISVPPDEKFWRYIPDNFVLDGLLRWDSEWYLNIVRNGYNYDSSAFFPLYPALIRLVSWFSGNDLTAGIWISNTSFLIALFYFYTIARQETDDETAGRAVFYIAAAPAAFFFSAVYSESVFFLFVVVAIYYARNKKWLVATIAGAFASATRLTGITVAIFLFFEALWQQGIRFIPKPWSLSEQLSLIKSDFRQLPRAWKGILASLFSTSGLIAYMAYQYHLFGDPISFLRVESAWNRTVGWDWFINLARNICDYHKITGSILSGNIGFIQYLMDTLAIFIFLPLVIIVLKKFRPSYGWFTLFTFLMPLVSGNPTSMRRYVLALLPCYFLLAVWGKRPWVDRVILGVSLPLQSYLLVLFTHWRFAG